MFQTSSGNAKLQFERSILLASRERPRIKWANKLMAPAVVLLGTLAVGSIFLHLHRQKTERIADIQDTIKQREGKDVKAEEKKSFCAVKCKGSGPFHLNETVFVIDLSTDKTYRKEFYTKKGNLYVEGVGDDSERWFRNPSWKGEVLVVKTIRMGERWFAETNYKGEEAEQKWAEIKPRF